MDKFQLPQFNQGRASARRRPTRPPRLRSFPVLPEGPVLYQVRDDAYDSAYLQFFVPPPGFLTFTNSASEWTIYVAIAKVLGWPRDPRKGPYVGWPGLWTYQAPVEGGRAARGGQVIDFVVHGTSGSMGEIAIRIQSERYHQFTDAVKHAVDETLRVRLARYGRVVDVFEQDFMQDRSGQAACVEVKRAIFGGSASNPLRSGQARRIRA